MATRRREKANFPRPSLLVLLVLAGVGGWLGRDGGRKTPRGRGEQAKAGGEVVAAGPVATASPGRAAGPGAALGRVEGVVRDALTGAALGGVDVVFEQNGAETTATSGAGGAFAADLPPGRYRVRAVGDDVHGAAPEPVAVGPGARVTGFDLAVIRLATIHGRVVDQEGAPVAGARVTFDALALGGRVRSQELGDDGAAESGRDGAFHARVVPGEVTLHAERDGARGRFALPWVEPGAELSGVEIVLDPGATIAGLVRDGGGAPVAGAVVVATAVAPAGPEGGRREARADAAGRFRLERAPAGRLRLEAHAPGHAPSTPLQLELASGEAREGVVLVLQAQVALRGRVVDAAGAPLAGVSLTVRRGGSSLAPARAATDAAGAFALELAPGGPYELVAEKPGYAAARRHGITAPAELELRLVTAGALAGVVRDQAGAPVAQFAVRVESFTPAGGAARLPGGPATRFVAADGAWRLEGLEPGAYDLIVSAPGFAPARRAGVIVPAGGEGDGSVTVSAGATVEGEVRSAATGAPVAGARVSALSGHEGAATTTDAAGRFVLADVAPGRRTITVRHPSYVHREEGGVELAPGGRRRVEIRLEPLDPRAPGRVVEFAGIGATLTQDRGRLLVAHLLPGGPAELAGLQPRDEIVSIDGQLTAGRALVDCIESIRGVAGTPVRLELRRGDATFVLDVVRATVRFGG